MHIKTGQDVSALGIIYSDGVCKCHEVAALNAGSACIPAFENGQTGIVGSPSCPKGQAYVAEIGTCLPGWHSLSVF